MIPAPALPSALPAPAVTGASPAIATVGDRGFALDAAVIAAVSVAICTASSALAFMTGFVPAVLALRLVLWTRLDPGERGGDSLARELVLLAACTGLGAFNDWNTVVGHGVYRYAVPHYFPSFSTIPLWMLLFWGMILRFLVTLFRWRRLSPPPGPVDLVYLPGGVRASAAGKIALELALVAVTRQLIYRTWADPVWSWLPFALALVVYVALFRLDRHDRRLVALFAIGGPLVEIAYIQLGHLHAYALGWLGGVPLWIALWWILAALLWKDLSARLLALLTPARAGARRGS